MDGFNNGMEFKPVISIVLACMIVVTALAKNEGEHLEPTTQPSRTEIRAEGWTLRVSLRASPNELASFDRDDPIFVRIELVSPPSIDAPDLTTAKGIHFQIRSVVSEQTVEVPLDAKEIEWEKISNHQSGIRWKTFIQGDPSKFCTDYPDGECEISVSWNDDDLPAFKTSPIRFLLKNVTLEDARKAAEEAADNTQPIRLEFDEKGIGGVLFNNSDRPISFIAGTGSERSVDAGSKSWSPHNSISIFHPTGWKPMMIGWCGTGAGPVIVQPGKSARLERLENGGLVNQGKAIWRASIRWRYADTTTNDEFFEVYSDPIEIDTPWIELPQQ